MMNIIRVEDSQVEIWYGEPNHPESDFIGTFYCDLVPQLIAELKHFEQSEGR
jgi:hypothetical protein